MIKVRNHVKCPGDRKVIIMNKDIKRELLSEKEISGLIKSLAERINRDYEGKEILLVVILKGSAIFASDLLRKITIDVKVDFMQASSYGSSAVSSGDVKIKKDIESDVRGKHVLIVEDIVDSGNTLSKLKKLFAQRGAASVKICTLLSKPSGRKTEVECEYVGTDIPDEFVVGYGLDFNERYRNLPYIGILKPEIYS